MTFKEDGSRIAAASSASTAKSGLTSSSVRTNASRFLIFRLMTQSLHVIVIHNRHITHIL